jgi:hypothetical protein
MELEKIRHRQEKNGCRHAQKNPQKHFAPRQGPAQLRRALSNETPAINTYCMLNFVYEEDIKVKDKYFATIYGLHICPK